MPFLEIDSPLAGRKALIHYRDQGEGACLVFLHGGWGYEVFSLDRQQAAIQGLRTIIPDRSGYGRSTKPAVFTLDFHRRAAQETLLCLDVLGIRQCIFWGHSDGAVIAAWLGLMAPERCRGLILEAFHYFRNKPNSREFFETMTLAPHAFGSGISRVLASEHGEPYWRELLRSEGRVWLEMAQNASSSGGNHRDRGPRQACNWPAGEEDLYEGRLSRLSIPAVFIHGARDPRTEPGELDAVRQELPGALFHIIEPGGHTPHSEEAAAEECSRAVSRTLALWKDN